MSLIFGDGSKHRSQCLPLNFGDKMMIIFLKNNTKIMWAMHCTKSGLVRGWWGALVGAAWCMGASVRTFQWQNSNKFVNKNFCDKRPIFHRWLLTKKWCCAEFNKLKSFVLIPHLEALFLLRVSTVTFYH